MDQLQQIRHKLFYKLADPRVKDWPLMNEPWICLSIIVVYLLLVYGILPLYMSSKKAYTFKIVLIAYNLNQVVMCIAIIYRAFITGFNLQHLACSRPNYGVEGVSAAENFWWILLIKMAEMIETCFFVLRKKFEQISILHVFHHASTFALAWLTCKYIAGGMLMFPLVLNSAVHVVMYSYYFLSCFGPKLQTLLQPFKSRITQIQLAQLVIIFFHSVQTLSPSCNITWVMPAIALPILGINILNFALFYRKMYLKKTN